MIARFLAAVLLCMQIVACNAQTSIQNLPSAQPLSPADIFIVDQLIAPSVRQTGQVPLSAIGQSLLGITINGTPTAVGQVLTATSTSTASWQSAQRTKLTSSLTLFADFVNGNDNNTCTAAGSGNACKTVQGAYNKLVLSYDTAGQNVTISFNANDTQCLVISTGWTGGGQVAIQGPGGSPPSVGFVCSGSAVTVLTPLPATLFLTGFKMSGSPYGVSVVAPGKVSINNVNMSTAGTAHLSTLVTGASIVCGGAYTISGNAPIHWYAALGGNITCQVPVTISGTPAFATAFAAADTLSLIYAQGASYSGSGTGPRYFVNNNAVVNTGTNNPSTLPGNSAGSTSNGGIYQ